MPQQWPYRKRHSSEPPTAWIKETPLSPLLFACGEKPCLEELEADLCDRATAHNVDASKVRVHAFLDDVIVVTPSLVAADVQPVARRALGRQGLELSPDKTQIWSRSGAKPHGVDAANWKQAGITLVGVPLGEAEAANQVLQLDDENRVDLGEDAFTEENVQPRRTQGGTLLGKSCEAPSDSFGPPSRRASCGALAALVRDEQADARAPHHPPRTNGSRSASL